MISHIVLFEPKPDVTKEQIKSFAQQFALVIESIPSIKRATVGKSIHVDTGTARNFGDQTYSFAAVMEFADREGLVEYLNHPAHRELGRLFWLSCKGTIVSEVEGVDAKSADVAHFLVNAQN